MDLVKDLVSPPLASLAQEPAREHWEHDGKCACGKRTYVFGRCVSCIEKEAVDDLSAGAREREKQEGVELKDGELAVDELFVVGARPSVPWEPRACLVHFKLVQGWANSWFNAGVMDKFVQLPRGLGRVAGRKWKAGDPFGLPKAGAEEKGLPYGVTWCVHPDWTMTMWSTTARR